MHTFNIYTCRLNDHNMFAFVIIRFLIFIHTVSIYVILHLNNLIVKPACVCRLIFVVSSLNLLEESKVP